MCKYCDYNDDNCEIFQDGASSDWYLNVRTDTWDKYDDDWIYERVFINYCPFCGRDLYAKK